MKKITFLVIAISTILFSCKKEKIPPELIGQWELYQICDCYLNGGSFMWNNVNNNDKKHYIFLKNNIVQSDNFNPSCDGDYSIKKDTISFHFVCNDISFKLGYSFISNDTLILAESVEEGAIKYKYIRK